MLTALLLALGSSIVPAAAQTVQSVGLSADNDGFVFWVPPDRREDRYYTHSLRVDAVLAWPTPWARLLGDGEVAVCESIPSPDPCTVARLVLGQEIYTPDFIFDEDPANHDRPYAGLLSLAATAVRFGPERSSSLGVELGVTGGPSLVAPFHQWFHRTLGKHEPLGWEHQIPFEPTFLVRYEARRFVPIVPSGRALSLRLEPHGGAALGTLRTGVWAGLSVDLGWKAPFWEGLRDPQSGPFFLRLGLGVEGEFVARDLFLDGSTWGSSIRATREPLVGRLRSRLQVGWGRLALEWAATHSTLEFSGQRGEHTFGTLQVRLVR